MPISAQEVMVDKLYKEKDTQDKMLKSLLLTSNTGSKVGNDKDVPVLSPDTIVTFRTCSPLAESNVPNPDIC